MKVLFSIFLIFSLLIISCGEDSKTESEKECKPACNNWQICNDKQVCVLIEGRCSEDSDCKDNTEGKTTCNHDTHTCIKPEELTCNENKTASSYKLPADECGELTACNDSYDCAEGQRCENLFNEVNELPRPCCIDGLRGCKKAGEPCETEFDCESGLCIAKNENQRYCSKTCDPDNNDCPDPISECKDLYVMNACVEPSEK